MRVGIEPLERPAMGIIVVLSHPREREPDAGLTPGGPEVP